MVVHGHIFNIFLFIFTVLAVPAVGALAAATVPPTCDSGFYDVLSSRAWMEGQREIEVAEKLILKPDSVLEYSCFSEALVKSKTAGTFTAVNAVGTLVETPYGEYINKNFGHTMAGGADASGIATTCGAMYQVWDMLKCKNFDKANFITFAELSGQDIRTLPEACSSPARNQKWSDELVLSYPPPADPAEPGGMMKVSTYFGELDPKKCSAKPIPTGLILTQYYAEEGDLDPNTGEPEIIQKSKLYHDAACLAPGCSLDPGGANIPSCK